MILALAFPAVHDFKEQLQCAVVLRRHPADACLEIYHKVRAIGEITMSTFKANLVSPEKLLFSDEVDQVDLPGLEGDFGVLAGHTPMLPRYARGHRY